MRLLPLITIGVILSCLPIGPVHSQSFCVPRADMLKTLQTEYGESPTAIGMANNGMVVELLRSEKTWTMIYTRPDGISCGIAAGENWEPTPVKKGQPS